MNGKQFWIMARLMHRYADRLVMNYLCKINGKNQKQPRMFPYDCEAVDCRRQSLFGKSKRVHYFGVSCTKYRHSTIHVHSAVFFRGLWFGEVWVKVKQKFYRFYHFHTSHFIAYCFYQPISFTIAKPFNLNGGWNSFDIKHI